MPSIGHMNDGVRSCDLGMFLMQNLVMCLMATELFSFTIKATLPIIVFIYF